MNELRGLFRREYSFIATVAGDSWTLGPIHFSRGCRFFWDESGDGFAVLCDDNFLASLNSAQELGAAVA